MEHASRFLFDFVCAKVYIWIESFALIIKKGGVVKYESLALIFLALLVIPGAFALLASILSGYHARMFWRAVMGWLSLMGEMMIPWTGR